MSERRDGPARGQAGTAQSEAEVARIIAALPATLKAAKAARAPDAPVLVSLADVRPEGVKWLWPGRVALGKITLLAGDPGLGKSFVTLDMAARVSTGAAWPDGAEAGPPGGAVLLSAEDDVADTIRPRLDAAAADVARVVALQAVRAPDPETGGTRELPFTLSADLPALEEAVEKTPSCRLVVIDPISAYLGGGAHFDSHRNSDVRAVLAPLAALAARRGVAVVVVTHLRKGEGPAMYRAMGSLAFVAAARAAWAVARDRDDPAGRRRLFLPVKNNLSLEQTGLAFELRPAGDVAVVTWEAGAVEVSADEALGPPPRRAPGPKAERRDEAAEWLRAALAGGPRLVAELAEEAREAMGFSAPTLRRARKVLGVMAFRQMVPGAWFWRLPTGAQGAQVPPKHEHLEHLEHLGKNTGKTRVSDGQDCKVLKLAEPEHLGPDGNGEDFL